MDRPFNTLFMLSSLDGKISTGKVSTRDFDKDCLKIKSIVKGLAQYYAIEKKTDFYSFNTGKVMAKIGMNKKRNITKIPVNFIILDNKPHLTKEGVMNMLKWCKKLFLVTTNKNHPAFKVSSDSLEILYYKKLNLPALFSELKKKYGIRRITIQSGGEMNSSLIRKGLIDRVSFVFAPMLVGGRDAPTLVDGVALSSDKDLKLIKALKLEKINKLKESYIHLVYRVL